MYAYHYLVSRLSPYIAVIQINFDWDRNWWQCVQSLESFNYRDLNYPCSYDMTAIEGSLANHPPVSSCSDLSFLIGHLRELPSETRKYLTWASFFGATYVLYHTPSDLVLKTGCSSFKVTEISLMMDWEDSGHEESDDHLKLHRAVSNMRDTNPTSSRGSMRGLQTAIAEGWLLQRARDMCSFAHDRYRQAAQADAETLPEEVTAKMRFRVGHCTCPSPSPWLIATVRRLSWLYCMRHLSTPIA
jgi:hypothetical protein